MSLDDLLKDLQGQKTVQEDPHSLSNLFHDSFMSKYSGSKSFEAFLEKGNFQVKSLDDISNIPDELFDRHVQRETEFADWKSMLAQARRESEAK